MALAPLERAKKITIYRNGDKNFTGKPFVVNRKRCPTWESLLDGLTYHVRSEEAVRSIRTPTGGSEVRALDQLKDNQDYVAVGRGNFRRLGYSHLNDNVLAKKITSPRNYNDVKPVEHSRIQVSGRIRKVRTDVMTIFVFTNGEDLKPARRVTLTHRTMNGQWPAILQHIDTHVQLSTGACRKLYTLDGDIIDQPGLLKNNDCYVAVADRFKHVNYGNPKPQFRAFPKRDPRYTELPPVVAQRRGRRNYYGKEQPHTMENSITSTGSTDRSQGSQRTYPGARRGPQQPRYRHYQNQRKDDGVFHAKPIKYKRSSESQREVDYDRDEGGVFKAKGGQRATRGAREVDEGQDTQVELPIDQVEAEEVEDEEIETDNQPKTQNKKSKSPPKPQSRVSTQHSMKTSSPHRSPTPYRASTPQVTESPAPQTSKPASPQSRPVTRPNSIPLSNHSQSPALEPVQSTEDAEKERSAAATPREQTPTSERPREPTPAESLREPTPAEQSREPTPAGKSREPTPVEKAREPTPAEKSREPTPVEKSREPTPVEKSREPTPVEKSREPTPVEKSREPTPVAKSREPTPIDKSREATPVEDQRESTPAPRPDSQQENDMDDKGEDAAATKIQANYKGYRTRQQLKEKQDQSKEGASEATVE